MKAEYINAFLSECVDVYKEVANIELVKEATTVKQKAGVCNDFTIIVGMIGKLRGCAAIHLPQEIVDIVIKNMMCGMDIDESVKADLTKSALCELSNMTMGKFATKLYNMGISIDITPPSIITGKDVYVDLPYSPLLSLKMRETVTQKSIEVDISIKDKD